MNIISIIPARGGSTEIPMKNLIKLDNLFDIYLAKQIFKSGELMSWVYLKKLV